MELKKAMEERRSVRVYKKEPVPKETLEKVLSLATRAISASNTQPWEMRSFPAMCLEKLQK